MLQTDKDGYSTTLFVTDLLPKMSFELSNVALYIARVAAATIAAPSCQLVQLLKCYSKKLKKYTIFYNKLKIEEINSRSKK